MNIYYKMGYIKGKIDSLKDTDFPRKVLEGFEEELTEVAFNPNIEKNVEESLNLLLFTLNHYLKLHKEGELEEYLERIRKESEALL